MHACEKYKSVSCLRVSIHNISLREGGDIVVTEI